MGTAHHNREVNLRFEMIFIIVEEGTNHNKTEYRTLPLKLT